MYVYIPAVSNYTIEEQKHDVQKDEKSKLPPWELSHIELSWNVHRATFRRQKLWYKKKKETRKNEKVRAIARCNIIC